MVYRILDTPGGDLDFVNLKDLTFSSNLQMKGRQYGTYI